MWGKIFGQQSTRSGSGRIVQENFVLLTEIWGGSPATTSLSSGIDGNTVGTEISSQIYHGRREDMYYQVIYSFNLSIHNVNLQVPFFYSFIIHDYIYLREPWSFKKYRVMANCFSTNNTSSPLGLLPGWRKVRNSSTTDMKTARSILKFFFHSLSDKILINKLSHHCSVLLEFLHILPRRQLILVHVSKSCNSGVAWTVNCRWWRLSRNFPAKFY